MNSISFSCQGESHIATGKVCQDYSYSHVYEDGAAIAIVCDGHGGKRYFRSDIGAKIAAEVAERKVRAFVAEGGRSLLQGTPFTQISAITTQIENQDFARQSEIERAFRRLAGSIIYEWDTQVKAHAAQNPILDEEKPDLEDRWIADFNEGHNLEKVYGCTLITYVYTPDFWFAFQIGDGKCFAVDKSGHWSEPIPWDDRCFLNKTTSICDSSAIDEFRFCYEGNGSYPVAMILGSDGIDDSFGASENQANFYVQILKSLVVSGEEATRVEIESTLPQLSKIGSRDDMSLAMVYDSIAVNEVYPKLIEWQIANVARELDQNKAKIRMLHKERKALADKKDSDKRVAIDYDYAVKGIATAIEARKRLINRYNKLASELESDTPKEFEDDIPYDKVVPAEKQQKAAEKSDNQASDVSVKASELLLPYPHKPKKSGIAFRREMKKDRNRRVKNKRHKRR